MTESNEPSCAAHRPKLTPDQKFDAALMIEIQAGNRVALAKLYDRHAERLLGFAYHILGHRGDAEDLLHDVFLEVWNRAASYDPQRGSVASWLMLRMRSRAIDRLRTLTTARQRAIADAAPDDCPAPPSSDPVLTLEHGLTRRAVMALSDVQRTVLESAYFEGLTLAEIAVRCKVPIGTVKSRLAAALTSLRQTFAEHGGTNDAV